MSAAHRQRDGDEERTVLVSVELVDAAAKAPVRRPAAVRRPEPMRPPVPPSRRGPTVIRPAFDEEALSYIDPADLARAGSQMTVAPGEVEAPSLREVRPPRRKKGPVEDLVVVSPSETDWTRSRPVERSNPTTGVAPGARGPGRRWLWPMLGVGATGATVMVVLMAAGAEPEVVVTPPVMVAEPEAVELESPVGQARAGAAEQSRLPAEARQARDVAAESETVAAETAEGEAAEAKAEQVVSTRVVEGPPVWRQTNESSNPWVEVKGAPPRTALGLGETRAGLTGFGPGDGVFAPTYDFRIQQREVSWEELGRFIFAEQRDSPIVPSWSPTDTAERAVMPATQVPWALADAYCRAMGGELPSEAEWEWAARGPTLATYPWGEDLPYADRVRFRAAAPVVLAAVGTMVQDVTRGARPIHDLLGNASEWTRDAWPGRDGYRAVRGWPLGKAGQPLPREGLSYRRAACADPGCAVEADFDVIGFRCVMR
jgi:formylglycine-generating enzyme required for sulfatase activity